MSFSWNEIFDAFFANVFFEARLIFFEEELASMGNVKNDRLWKNRDVFEEFEEKMTKGSAVADSRVKDDIFKPADKTMTERLFLENYEMVKGLGYETEFRRNVIESFLPWVNEALEREREQIGIWTEKSDYDKISDERIRKEMAEGVFFEGRREENAFREEWEKSLDVEKALGEFERALGYGEDYVFKNEIVGDGEFLQKIKKVDKTFLKKILEPEINEAGSVQNIKFEINGDKSVTEDIDMDRISDMLTDKLCEMMSRGADGIYF